MRKQLVLFLTGLLLLSCGGEDKKARIYYDAAEQAFANKEYSRAKILLDSVKISYPKAFETRKAGIQLLQRIELQEQQEVLAYLDSLLAVKKDELEAVKGKFIFEKEEEYQDIGNYIYPSQTIEKNLHRCYLRGMVNERGAMTLTSIYCGGHHIHHHAIKVSTKDGSFAETPFTRETYETTDLGEKIEKADYKMGEDGTVIGFIHINKEENIKVEYIGERKFVTNMLPTDRIAISELYELSGILTSITNIENERAETNRRLEFVRRKIQENSLSEE